MLLIYNHLLDVTFLYLFDEIVKPVFLCFSFRLFVDDELIAFNSTFIVDKEEVLELFNRVLVHYGHYWVRVALRIFLV